MNSSFPDRWPLSYPNTPSTQQVNQIQTRTARTSNYKEPQQQYRLGTVSIKILGGFNRFYKYPTSPSASVKAQNIYCIMGYFCIAKFSRFYLKTWGFLFADFNIRGSRRPRKIISILFREIRRVGGRTRLSLYRTNVRKENPTPNEYKILAVLCQIQHKNQRDIE